VLDIFLTNKIPSSEPSWTDELILVASIFSQIDGLVYDRQLIEESFETISNRIPDTRDASDYRDEYGAYASYLGLMHYEPGDGEWISRFNAQARDLICGPYPDPQAFMRIQMSLFQYPNPIGASYRSNGGMHLEASSNRKRVQQIRDGVRTVPLRLFLRVLLSLYGEGGAADAYLTYPEIWHCLFSNRAAINTFDPDGDTIARRVRQFRRNPISSHPTTALRNLHILQHTGLIRKPRHVSRLELNPLAGLPSTEIGAIAHAIAGSTSNFPVPPAGASTDGIAEWARNALNSGDWSSYYSGQNLPTSLATSIASSVTEVAGDLINGTDLGPNAPLLDFDRERRERRERMVRRIADPLEAQALRERANLAHRTLLEILAGRLRANNVRPMSNVFIDLACLEPKRMIFEVKSCNSGNFIDQVRKGVSQLYEYRYRNADLEGARLVLALEEPPRGDLTWLIDYLVGDRSIAVMWLEGESNLACPSYCRDCLGNLVNRIEQMPV